MAERPAFNLSISEFLSVGAVIASIAVAFTFIRADVVMLKTDVSRLQIDVSSITESQQKIKDSQSEIKHTVDILLDRSTRVTTQQAERDTAKNVEQYKR